MNNTSIPENRQNNGCLTFTVGGMDCPSCEGTVTNAVKRLSGVERVESNHFSMKLKVFGDDSREQQERIIKHISSMGYKPRADNNAPTTKTGKERTFPWNTVMLAVAAVLVIAAGITGPGMGLETISKTLLLLSLPLSGFQIYRKGIIGFMNRSLDMNSLMALATTGALFIGEWFEAALVLLLGSIAEYLEGWSADRARSAVDKLMALTPAVAIVRRNGKDIELPPAEVMEGETIIIKPGSQVPLDGKIIDGASEMDQSAITGESLPVSVETGDKISSGSINGSGVLVVTVSETLENSTVSRIARMVEEAQSNKAQTQRFIDSFANVYTPLVIAIAAVIALVPPLFMGQWAEWFYRALAMLIIACPCALVISTPAAIVSGLAASARSGLLIRGGQFLEIGSKIDSIFFDKTGTLTEGLLQVGSIHPAGDHTEQDVLAAAAAVEAGSEHPIATAILSAAEERDVKFTAATATKALPGKGVTGEADNGFVVAGTYKLVKEQSPEIISQLENFTRQLDDAKSHIYVTRSNELLGVISLTDRARPEAKEAVETLQKLLGGKLTILSGDDKNVVRSLAQEVGIENYHGRLLPEEKLGILKERKGAGETILMVGDGINDAPALTLADVGVAMGSRSADVALESADVALVGDDLRKIPYFLRIAKKTMAIMTQNIALSLGVKAVFLLLAAFGYITLWLAVLADTGLSLLVTSNSMRLLTMKRSFEKKDG